MPINIHRKFLKVFRYSASRLIQVIILCLWFTNLLTCSLIYQNAYTLSSTTDIPVHTLINYDLTSPEKLFYFQNETKRITENLKVQSLFNLNLAVLLKTDLHQKKFAEISTSEDRPILLFVFIETTNPRSPPYTFI